MFWLSFVPSSKKQCDTFFEIEPLSTRKEENQANTQTKEQNEGSRMHILPFPFEVLIFTCLGMSLSLMEIF